MFPPPLFCIGGVFCLSRVSKEQIAKAREWDLLSYLQAFEPHELKRCGPNEYCTKTHDSLKISNGKWHWHSQKIGGRSALDYLIKVRGIAFTDAVEMLCGYRAPPQQRSAAPPQQKPFSLPEASRWPTAVVAYLQDRGIDPELVSVCLQSGTLYQSRKYQNCVFVGRDTKGRARSANLRGTRYKFRLEAAGSDKRYGFCLPARDAACPRLVVAESPIDALSLATLVKMSGGNWQDNYYLSLGGTGPRAMLQFLCDHPHVSQISLCLDNDKAGREGMNRLEQAIQTDTVLSQRIKLIYRNPPPVEQGKDYNEFLCTHIRQIKQEKQKNKVR